MDFFGVIADLDADRSGRLFADCGITIHMAGVGAFNRIRARMRSGQSDHKQAEYSGFEIVAYLLRLAIVEAEDIVSDVAPDEDE